MASDPRVSFGATTYEAASTASIVNGRILGATDQNALFYDLNGTRHEVSGMSVTIDSALSSTSTNPVQNKVVTAALDGKASTAALTDGSVTKIGTESVGSATTPIYLNAGVPSTVSGPIPVELGGTGSTAVDSTPTEGSNRMVTSGGVYSAISAAGMTVDSALSTVSENAVQNKVITLALEGKQSTLSFDSAPTENSTNPVTSGGVYTAIEAAKTVVDDAISSTSSNPVQNSVIYTALEGKQSTLSFDTAPTENSTNPVTSGGVYTYVNNAVAANMDVDISISAVPPTTAPAHPSTSIYIVLVPNGEQEGNLYDEYLWVNSNSAWEKLGTQEMDLSGYQKLLTPGDNISISTASNGSTISASHPTISTTSASTSSASPALGGTLNVIDSLTRDSNGHITTWNTNTVTLPTYTQGTNITISNGEISSSHPAVSTSAASTSSAAPSPGGTVDVIDAITRDSNGHVTTYNTKTITIPEQGTLPTPRNLTTDLASTVSASFDGSADASIGVTGVLPVANGGTGQSSVDSTPTENSSKMITSGGVYTALGTKQDTLAAGANISFNGSTISSSHPVIGSPSATTSTAAPDFGETFTVIDSITTDSNGHVTAINTKTVTVPAMYWVVPEE